MLIDFLFSSLFKVHLLGNYEYYNDMDQNDSGQTIDVGNALLEDDNDKTNLESIIYSYLIVCF